MINTLFILEGKIPNDSKVIAFTRNHADNVDEDGDDDEDYDDNYYFPSWGET